MIGKYIRLVFSLPKSFYMNFRWLPFKKAIKFPILISFDASLRGGGKIVLPEQVKFGMVHIGFHRVPICNPCDKTIVIVDGTLELKGRFHIGNGAKIRVTNNSTLSLGNNFGISASSAINCYNRITIGDNVLFSWDCLVMDSDTHPIFGSDSEIINRGKEIIIGEHVWVGCRSTILKGSIIPDGCVIGACSLVSGTKFEPSTIITGQPAKSVKHIENWEEQWKGFA